MEKLNAEINDFLKDENGPYQRSWFSQEQRTKLKSIISKSESEKMEPSYQFVAGVLKVYEGGIASDLQEVENGLDLLKASAKSSFLPATLELSWLSCFLKDTGDREVVKEEKEGTQSREFYRIQAVAKMLEGAKESSLVALAKASSCSDSDYRDEEAQSIVKGDGFLSPFGGYLFPESDVSNLHHPRLIHRERTQFQLFLFQQVIANQNQNPEVLFEATVTAFVLGEYRQAKEWLKLLIEAGATNSDVYALLGFVNEKQGELEQAQKQYRLSLKENPNHPLSSTNLASYYLANGNVFLAENLLEGVLKVTPDYPEALSLYGRTLAYHKERRDEAMECLKKAINLDVSVAEYHINYCLAGLQLGFVAKLQGEWSYHKQYMQNFTEKGNMRRLFNIVLGKSKDPLQDIGIAEMLNQNGFYEAAKTFVQKAWKRGYTVASAKKREFTYFVGFQSAQCGEFNVALDAYQQWEKDDRVGGVATTCVAMVLNDLDRCEEALTTIEQCDLSDSKLSTIKAGILWKLGRNEEALVLYNEALSVEDCAFTTVDNGARCAIQTKDKSVVESLFKNIGKKWNDSSQLLALKGMSRIVIGDAEAAIQILEEKLMSGEDYRVLEIQTKKSKDYEDNLFAPYYVLGCAYIENGSEKLKSLLNFLGTKLQGGAIEWEVLTSMSHYKKGLYEEALLALTSTNTSPTANLTRALCYRELGELKEAKVWADRVLEKGWKVKPFYHLEGDIAEVAESISSI